MVAPRRFALIGHIHEASTIVGFDEAAQDAVGSILVDSATIDFTYNDATPSITAATIPAGILAQLLTVDGAGSLLDADFLDGLSSASFALAATTVTAGAGLTGSGTLGANLTLAVGAGNGITVNTDDVALNLDYAPTWTNTHTWTDNDKVVLGTGSDLSIYHDGTDSIIDNNTGALSFVMGTTESLAILQSDGIVIRRDNYPIYMGASDDFFLYHDGTDSFIRNATGKIVIKNAANAAMEFYTNNVIVGQFAAAGNLLLTNALLAQTSPTSGVILVGDRQSATESLAVLGAMNSTAAILAGYGVKPKGSGGDAVFVSSYGSSIARSAGVWRNGTISFYTATATTTAVGSDVTMNERVAINASDVTIKNASGSSKIKMGGQAEIIAIAGDDASGECYIGFYESNAFSTRKCYLGFGNAGDDQFFVMNEESSTMTLGTAGAARLNISATSLAPVPPIYAPNGTVSDPSYSFGNDTDCGIYRTSTANNWALVTNGVRAIDIAATTTSIRANNADMIVCNSTGIGFNNQTPIARPDYTVTNKSLNRSVDCNGLLAAIGDNLGSLVDDLISYGLLQ